MTVKPSDFGVWRSVAADGALRSAVAQADPTRAADLERLRALAGLEAVRVALALLEARRKAVRKFGVGAFGPHAEALIADAEGVEQASSPAAAWPKAQRFAAALSKDRRAVLDLGCGVGGDAWALRQAGCEVVAFDRDPMRAAMAAHNAGCRAVVADLSTLGGVELGSRLIHLDPARRARDEGHTASRRTWSLEDMRPTPGQVRRLIDASDGAAVKLSPGVDPDAAREAFGDGELCFTSEPDGTGRRRKLSQATWYAGALKRPASRSAVMVFGEVSERTVDLFSSLVLVEVAGEPRPSVSLDVAAIGGFLVVPDPALERAELLPELGLPTLHPGLGLLTAEALPGPDTLSADAASWFEVLAEMPWRERSVKRWLAEHDGGVVEVKTRGRAVEPDALQRRLRGSGRASYTLFVLRLGRQVRALVTRPVCG